MNPVKLSSCRSIGIAGGIMLGVAIGTASGEGGATSAFRVCADPNNLPFSSKEGSGFEDKLAEIIAADLSRPLTYVWHPQRRGFIRNTLKIGVCDAVMGLPADLGMVTPSRPYYRSTYVFLYRQGRGLDGLTSMHDRRLRDVSIGVQLIGDEGYNTPPAHALSAQGIVDNLVGYTVYGDYRASNPPARIVDAVAAGAVDVAAVWGPLAGYFAPRENVPLTWRLSPTLRNTNRCSFDTTSPSQCAKVTRHSRRGSMRRLIVIARKSRACFKVMACHSLLTTIRFPKIRLKRLRGRFNGARVPREKTQHVLQPRLRAAHLVGMRCKRAADDRCARAADSSACR